MANGVAITFYSYKGGVGRSFMLANVAAVLAIWGYKVLCVDWDLEAPGLAQYFGPWLASPVDHGLVEFVEQVATVSGPRSSRRLLTPIDLPRRLGSLHLVAAGREDNSYMQRMQGLDWSELYSRRDLGLVIEDLRTQWVRDFDFVLIDSRTGITDIGGICTVQLPDILAFMFTASGQSLRGAVEVVKRSVTARNLLPYDRAGLLALPIPSRFEGRVEYERAAEWRRRFVAELAPFYTNWAVRSITAEQLVERTIIPNFPFWTFGEELPVLEEPPGDPDLISYHVETVAALIAHKLTNSDLLVRNRDSYVDAAISVGLRGGRYEYDVVINSSEAADDIRFARKLADLLKPMRVVVDEHRSSDLESRSPERILTGSQHMLLLVGANRSREQDMALERFLRQTLDERSDRTVFPVFLEGASRDLLHPLLRNSSVFTIDPNSPAILAERIRTEVGRLHTAASARPRTIYRSARHVSEVGVMRFSAEVSRALFVGPVGDWIAFGLVVVSGVTLTLVSLYWLLGAPFSSAIGLFYLGAVLCGLASLVLKAMRWWRAGRKRTSRMF